eukprot:m.142487 g.142487  ORF g.142487 m.142487 type:complete len:626 (+) comp17141_c0_seq2:222-2099(+)
MAKATRAARSPAADKFHDLSLKSDGLSEGVMQAIQAVNTDLSDFESFWRRQHEEMARRHGRVMDSLERLAAQVQAARLAEIERVARFDAYMQKKQQDFDRRMRKRLVEQWASLEEKRAKATILKINVSGTIFTTKRATLSQVPGSHLSEVVNGRASETDCDEAGNLFFDRDPKLFEQILGLLRGAPAQPDVVTDPVFLSELKFYGLLSILQEGFSANDEAQRSNRNSRSQSAGEADMNSLRKARQNSLPSARRKHHSTDGTDGEGGLQGDEVSQGMRRQHSTPADVAAAVAQQQHRMARQQQQQQEQEQAPPPVDPIEWAPIRKGRHASTDGGESMLLYAVGGNDKKTRLDSVERYDDSTHEWTPLQSMPIKVSLCGMAAVKSRLFVVGGYDGTTILDTVLQYNAETNQWSTVAHMSVGRRGCAAAVSHGQVYVVGGGDGKTALSSVERYDPLSRQCVAVPSMLSPRAMCCCVPLGGRLFVLGGVSSGRATQSVETYDAVSDCWTAVAPMLTPRFMCGAAVLQNKIYVVGGYDGKAVFSSVERYSLDTNEWEAVAPMATRRRGCGCAVVNGNLYAIGGFDGEANLSSVEAYDPRTNTWQPQTAMSTPRHGGACAVLPRQLITVIV